MKDPIDRMTSFLCILLINNHITSEEINKIIETSAELDDIFDIEFSDKFKNTNEMVMNQAKWILGRNI